MVWSVMEHVVELLCVYRGEPKTWYGVSWSMWWNCSVFIGVSQKHGMECHGACDGIALCL